MMLPYYLHGISLMHIQVFLLCAERLNFTKAASEMHITPGMVSKKISALESALEMPLFVRDKNRVSLTSDGKELFDTWKPLAEEFLRHTEELRQWDRSQNTITVGLGETTNLERYFIPLSSSFSVDEVCSFRFSMKEGFDLLDDLKSGQVDVVFAPKFIERGIRQSKELEYFMAVPSPLYAGLAESNPLLNKSVLKIEDLRDMEVMLMGTAQGDWTRWYREMIRELFHRHGLEPKPRESSHSDMKTVYLTLDEKSVLIIDKYYYAFQSKALEFRELENTESGLLMIWKTQPRKMVRRFIEYARDFYQELR